MWDMIRGLASRIAEALGISVPEVPDVTGTLEEVRGAAESAVAGTQTAAQAATEQLGGVAQSARSAASDATATAAESAADVTKTVQ